MKWCLLEWHSIIIYSARQQNILCTMSFFERVRSVFVWSVWIIVTRFHLLRGKCVEINNQWHSVLRVDSPRVYLCARSVQFTKFWRTKLFRFAFFRKHNPFLGIMISYDKGADSSPWGIDTCLILEKCQIVWLSLMHVQAYCNIESCQFICASLHLGESHGLSLWSWDIMRDLSLGEEGKACL